MRKVNDGERGGNGEKRKKKKLMTEIVALRSSLVDSINPIKFGNSINIEITCKDSEPYLKN